MTYEVRFLKLAMIGALGVLAMPSTAQALTCNCPSDPTTPQETCPADTVCLTYSCQVVSTGCEKCAPTNAPATTACTDNNACTTGDHCNGLGACSAGAPAVCNDANACTADSCSPASGCVYTPQVGTACSDANACTTGDACNAAGACQGGAALNCDDNNPCTADSCDPANAATPCKHVALTGAACNDNNACTSGDKCTAAGVCGPGTTLNCNDNNPCTTDSCSPTTGCAYTPNNGVACSDNNVCTMGDKCSNGACVGGTPLKCDDNNPCTSNSCSASSGCVFTKLANGTACDDENGCTSGDVCNNGSCAGTGGPSCNDNNECTKNSCNAGLCSNPPEVDTTPCDDGNKCTLVDSCSAGKCVGSGPPDCDDNDPCTTDSCDPAKGCVHELGQSGECNDKDPCTENDVCADGKCSGKPIDCATADDCHETGTCDATTGACVNPEKADGSPCEGGKCMSGACVLDGSGGSGGKDGGTAGGVAKDAGADARADDFSPDEGGCNCRVTTRSNSSSPGLLLLGIASAIGALRRRVRKAPESRR